MKMHLNGRNVVDSKLVEKVAALHFLPENYRNFKTKPFFLVCTVIILSAAIIYFNS